MFSRAVSWTVRRSAIRAALMSNTAKSRDYRNLAMFSRAVSWTARRSAIRAALMSVLPGPVSNMAALADRMSTLYSLHVPEEGGVKVMLVEIMGPARVSASYQASHSTQPTCSWNESNFTIPWYEPSRKMLPMSWMLTRVPLAR